MSDVPPQQKLCPSCGTSVPVDANLCSNCGYNFNSGPFSQPPRPGTPYNPGANQPGQYGTYQSYGGGYQPQGSYVRPGYETQESGAPDALAITSLVFGVLSVLGSCFWCVALPLGGLGVIFGIFGLKGKFRGLAISGIICGAISIVISIVIVAIIASGALKSDFGP